MTNPTPGSGGDFAGLLAALSPDEIEILSAHLGGGWAKQMVLAGREPVVLAGPDMGYHALFRDVGNVLDDLHAAWVIAWPRRARKAGAA